jgi:hypothetical protein
MNNVIENTMDWYSGINELLKRYQPYITLAKDNSNLFTNSHTIFKRENGYFCWLLNKCDSEIHSCAADTQA